jgi:hypothetical protein
MRARHLILLTALALVPAHLGAQTAGPTLYVSNGNMEILSVNAATGETAVIQTLDDIAGDIEVCGDGRLYAATFTKIYRMKKDGTELETIFDQFLHEVGTPLGQYYPQGLACDGSGNLLTNSRFGNGGVWRIANVAGTPVGGTFATPEDMTGTFTGFGEDLVILKDGSIAGVASAEDRVVRFAPGFGAQSVLIPATGPAPAGFSQSISGDFFVADLFQVARYDSAGAFIGNVSNFADGEGPYMLELDLNNNVYVATMNGGIYRLGADASEQLIASIPGAMGLGLDLGTAPGDHRRFTITRDSRTATASFGNNTLEVTFSGGMEGSFNARITRRLVAPANLPTRLANTVSALALPGDNGFVTVLTVRDQSDDDDDDDDSDHNHFSGTMNLKWAFNYDGRIERMMLLREIRQDGPNRFVDEMADFSLVGDTETDPIVTGSTRTDGRFYLASDAFARLRYTCDTEPAQTEPLPTFGVGQNVRLRFKLRKEAGCLGGIDPLAVAQLTVVRVGADHKVELQKVQSGIHPALANYFLFNPANNYYVYQLKTNGYSAGLHCATIFFRSPWAGAEPSVACFNIAP